METDAIAGFLAECAKNNCTRVQLVSCATGQAANVASFELGAEHDATAERIWDRARRDTAGERRPVRFELRVGEDRFAFVVPPLPGAKGERDDEMTSGEVVRAVLDHALDTKRQADDYADRVFGHMARLADNQALMLGRIENSMVKALDLYGEMVEQKGQREIEQLKAKTQAENTKKALDGFMPLLPAVANRMLGRATGEPAPLADELITAALGSLSHEELMKMIASLPPAKQAAFVEIYEAYAARAAKQQEKEQANGAAAPSSGEGAPS